jgi:hypothetical protein
MGNQGSDESGAFEGELEAAERGIREWLLLDGHRLTVAGLVAAAFLGWFVALDLLGLVPLGDVQATFYVYSGLIGGNLTLVTVVVSINQLLLSRQLESPGELREDIEQVVDYRETVEDAAGEIVPVQPMGFLRILIENTREEAQNVGGLATGTTSEAHEEIDGLVTRLTEHFDRLDDLLQRSGTGTFAVLSTTLSTNYARDINRIRRLRSAYGEELDEPIHERLGRLVERLEEIDVARQYFKSIYLQQELSKLSRVLLYAGLPAEAVAVAMLLALTADPGTALAHGQLRAAVPASLAVAFLPLAVLVSFILRTATVTQRTAPTVPFTTPEQEG